MQSKNSLCNCGSGKKYKMCCGKGVSKDTGKGVDFTVGKSANVNYARRFATKQDYIENIDMVIKVWDIYKDLYVKEIQKTGGVYSVDAINRLIIIAKKEAGATLEHEVAVEGFFDSYVAQMTTVGNSKIVHSSVDAQLNEMLKEKYEL